MNDEQAHAEQSYSPRVCEDCGRENPHYANPPLCHRCHKARRRADPVLGAHDRETSRLWKERNRERNRRRDREHGVHPCEDCGTLVVRKARRCQACNREAIAEARRARFEAIQHYWMQGLQIKEIAFLLQTTPGAIGVAVHAMREEGWEVPFRRTREIAHVV